jgi:3-oxoacyl-[acyl-carrier-protein] synthase-1
LGIVSCIGNSAEEVIQSLREGRSGIRFVQAYADHGFRSHIAGQVDIDVPALIDRKVRRFMGDTAAYAYIAMDQAIKDSGLPPELVSHEKTGLVVGSGGCSSQQIVEAADKCRETGSTKKLGPYMVPRTMSSTTSACLATPFKIRGTNYTISSACATSAHCIGHGAELIQMGKQDIVFAGGGEEEDWTLTMMFDAMGALSSKYNDAPETASRPYDATRDGFVIAGGAGMVVLEEYEAAKARGAKIYAELTGYGASSDGYDMVAPSGEGAVRCMNIALETARSPVEYMNTHGTSTPVGDTAELGAIAEVFGKDNCPSISSTKSLTGHSLGATGAQEAIYSLLMMDNDFMCASANITQLDEKAEGLPILREAKEGPFNCAMSNSFGFGGTNSTLIFEKV